MSKTLKEFKTDGQSNNNRYFDNGFCGYFTCSRNSYSLAYDLF